MECGDACSRETPLVWTGCTLSSGMQSTQSGTSPNCRSLPNLFRCTGLTSNVSGGQGRAGGPALPVQDLRSLPTVRPLPHLWPQALPWSLELASNPSFTPALHPPGISSVGVSSLHLASRAVRLNYFFVSASLPPRPVTSHLLHLLFEPPPNCYLLQGLLPLGLSKGYFEDPTRAPCSEPPLGDGEGQGRVAWCLCLVPPPCFHSCVWYTEAMVTASPSPLLPSKPGGFLFV